MNPQKMKVPAGILFDDHLQLLTRLGLFGHIQMKGISLPGDRLHDLELPGFQAAGGVKQQNRPALFVASPG